MLELSLTQWLLFSFAAVALGIAKGGFSGVSLVSVFILVEVFGPKEQLGVALPMLLFGDLCVYPAFRKYGNWQEAIKILLPSLVGMALAVCIIWYISDAVMERVIGVIILSMVGLQIWKMLKPEVVARVAEAQGFTVFAGLAGGVATMLANVAGPINQLYLLSRNIPKMDLIGIGARFFLIINWLKVPIYMLSDFGVKNGEKSALITWQTLMTSVIMFPLILLGVFIGKKLLIKVPQKLFEWFIISFAVIAGARLMM